MTRNLSVSKEGECDEPPDPALRPDVLFPPGVGRCVGAGREWNHHGGGERRSGAVLPGVTVEAASPALIEKVRTAVTDGQGLYRIVDLRPGAYTVTFTLPGFSTLKRDGLELTAGFTATVNADLKVGELAETITVSGETPVVDLQNVRQQTTLSRTTLEALPTTGRISQLVNFIPGAVIGNPVWQSVGGLDERANAFSAHGGRFDDNVPIIDGLPQRLQGGAVFVFNQLTFQEVGVETGGTSADRNTGGVQMNIVPRDGGNTFSGAFNTSHSASSLQAGNLNDDLRARGLSFSSSLKKHYDTGGAFGGPILRDRLWFFAGSRFGANQQYQQGNYFNKLQNQRVGTDPVYRVTFYEPDLSRPAFTDDYYRDFSLRLTWQASKKNKLVVSYEAQPNCSCFWPILELGPQNNVQGTPEAVGAHNYKVNYLPLVTWTSAVSSRLLIEAGASANVFDNETMRTDPSVGTDTIAITELSTNFRYGSRALSLTHAGGYRIQHNRQYRQRGSVSYITGQHSLKTGVDLAEYSEGAPDWANDANQINGARSYTFRDRIPQQVTIWAVPFEALWRSLDIAAYAQDQWTIQRLTLNLGLRFNNFNGHAPETRMIAGPWVPARVFPADEERPELDQHQSEARRRLRPVRQRQDRGEGVVRAIYAVLDRGRRHSRQQPGKQHDTNMERQRELRARLRPAESVAERRVRRVVGPDIRADPRGEHAPGSGRARRFQPAGLQLAAGRAGAAPASAERGVERRLLPHVVR